MRNLYAYYTRFLTTRLAQNVTQSVARKKIGHSAAHMQESHLNPLSLPSKEELVVRARLQRMLDSHLPHGWHSRFARVLLPVGLPPIRPLHSSSWDVP